jgi:nicotinamidase-related amidase
MNNVIRLSREHTALAVIDMQEAFRPIIPDFTHVAGRIAAAVQGARLLEIPIIVTEQYPKGLKHTATEILSALPDQSPAIEKLSFSSCGVDQFRTRLREAGIKQVLVCGIEAHICVTQTVLDLLSEDYQVFLLADCITSRARESKEIAFARLTQAGAVLSNLEMALFEMMKTSASPQFKLIQQLIK